MKIRLFFFFFTLCFLVPRVGEAGKSVSFRGDLNTIQKEARIDIDFFEGGSLSARIKFLSEEKVLVEAKCVHLKAKTFDLSTELESVIQKISPKGWSSGILGNIKSRYSLLNFMPTNELSGHFEIQNGQIAFQPLIWGNLTLRGIWGVIAPYNVDISLEMDQVHSKDLLFVLGYKGDETHIKGVITGKIKLAGTLDSLGIQGHLKARNGFLEDVDYDVMNLNFEGTYPIVYIEHSNIVQSDGLSFNIEGDFNLSKGQSSLERGMLALDKLPIVDERGVHREWTIKRRQEEGTSSVTEFKYRQEKAEKDEINSQDGNMISVERSIKF